MKVDPTKVTELERTIPNREPVHPQVEIWRLMHDNEQRRRADREECRKEVAAEHARLAELVVDVVNARHQLMGFLASSASQLREVGLDEEAETIAAIDSKLDQLIRRGRARVLRLEGERYGPEIAEWVDVVASVPAPGLDGPVVRDTIVPGVLLEAELLQRAQVVLAVPEGASAAEAGEEETR